MNFEGKEKELPWTLPDDGMKIAAVDSHAGGEPFRVVVDGFPELKGETILEKRRFIRENCDHLRKRLMWEPRGHSDMYGALITEPENQDSDIGVIFMHNEGYSTMCGHGIIALVKVVFELGMISKKEVEAGLRIDTPAGPVNTKAELKGDSVVKASFINVPSFAYKKGRVLEISGVGEIEYDIGYGGAFYVYCRAKDAGVDLSPEGFGKLVDRGRKIKEAVSKKEKIEHPFEDDLGFLYGTIFTGGPEEPRNFGRNVCVFADGEVDRSPTGTGVSGRAALRFSRGEMKEGEEMVIESILGTTFKVKINRIEDFGGYRSVIPEVSGKAFITGKSEFYVDPEDPLKDGFFLR